MEKILQTERVDLFDPRINIVFKTSIESNDDDLKQNVIHSIKKCYEKNEVTRSRIVLNHDKAYYLIGNHSACNIREVNSIDEIESDYDKPLDIFHGELMDVYIIDEVHKVNLVFICHHLFGDGNAVILFIEQIMNELNGMDSGDHHLHLILLDDILKKEKLSFIYQRYIDKENKKAQDIAPYKEEDYYKAYEVNNKVHYHIEEFSISLTQLEKIHKDAKRIGITLNSYFFALLLKSNPTITNVGFAASIRENESLSNQVSGNAIRYKYKINKSFEYNALKIHNKIKMIQTKHPYLALEFMSGLEKTLIDSIVLNQYGLNHYDKVKIIEKLYGFHESTKREVGITNLTKVRIHRNYGKYTIGKIVFIPPITSYTKRTMGIITDTYGCHFTFHCIDDEKEKHIFKNFIRELHVDPSMT